MFDAFNNVFLLVHVLPVSTFLLSLIGLVMCWETCIPTCDSTSQLFGLIVSIHLMPKDHFLAIICWLSLELIA